MSETNFQYEIQVSLISLYDTTKESIQFDTDSFANYLLHEMLITNFLEDYESTVFKAYIEFLSTKKKIDIDFVCKMPDDFLKTLRGGFNTPYSNVLNHKTYAELNSYLNKLKSNKEHKFVWNPTDKFLHFHNGISVYKKAVYMPEFITLNYKEVSKGVFIPDVMFDDTKDVYVIKVGLLMKKYKQLHIS